MANVSILWRKVSDAGTLSGGSWVAGLPLANLQQQDLQRVARSTNAATASTRFRVDLGEGFEPISCFALLNHNGTIGATWRIVVTSDPTDVDVAARTLDTGALNLWQENVVFGQLPWGVFNWEHIDPNGFAGGTLALHLTEQEVEGRYVWIYVTDTANPAGFFQAGRFLAGQPWQPAINMDFGAAYRWVDPSEVARTRGGRRIVTPRTRYRVLEMSFGALSQDEAFGGPFDMQQRVGKGGDFLLITDPQDDPNMLSRRVIYAAMAEMQPVVNPAFQLWGWTLTAEELT